MELSKELAWFAMPVIAILSQIGGTWWKPARRFIAPAVLCLTLAVFGISVYRSILCGIGLSIGACLPITVGKGDVREWWQFSWLFLLGYLLGLPAAIIAPEGFYLALFPMVIYGGLAALSNFPDKRIANLVPWKFFEGFAWCAVCYPYFIQVR
jgi:hypothetical protein